MRTPATAAREAVEGKDETLWEYCWCKSVTYGTRGKLDAEKALECINAMSPEERRLYDIQEE